MRCLRSRSRAFSALVVWMAVIFAFSSIPGGSPSSDMPLLMLFERKGAHVFEFLILFLLAYNAFRLTFPKETFRFLGTLAVSFSLLYAFSDETHQLFVPGREGKLSDVGIDVAGIVLGACAVYVLFGRWNFRSIRKKQSRVNPL